MLGDSPRAYGSTKPQTVPAISYRLGSAYGPPRGVHGAGISAGAYGNPVEVWRRCGEPYVACSPHGAHRGGAAGGGHGGGGEALSQPKAEALPEAPPAPTATPAMVAHLTGTCALS